MSERIADFKARIALIMKDAPLESVTNMELHKWRRAVVRKPSDRGYYRPNQKEKAK